VKLVKLKRIIFISSLFAVFFVAAQKKKVDEELVQVATEMYNFGDKNDALDVFLQAVEVNPENVQANYMAGICYLEGTKKFLAVNFLLRTYELNPAITPDILYKIAKGYHLGGNFTDAIKYYNQYKLSITAESCLKLKSTIEEEKKNTDRRIFECYNAIEYYKNPQKQQISKLSGFVNSEYAEYAPAVTADQSEMIFTSRRVGGISANKDVDNDFFEDVYISKMKNGSWNAPKNIGKQINSETHDASIGFSSNGKILFIYKPYNGGDIYYSSRLNDTTWSELKNMGAPINSKYNEPSVSISQDGNTLFFSSDRPGGYGKLDLYKSERQFDGKWGQAINLGPTINTEYDEDSPFISLDSKTLYFSSKGHKGMGEYDIFKTEYIAKTNYWMQPINLGYPVNSPDNDIYFVISGDNNTGYYASAKEGGLGGNDIYQITLSVPNEPVATTSNSKTLDKKPVIVKPSNSKSKSSTSATETPIKITNLKLKILDGINAQLLSNAKISIVKFGTKEERKELAATPQGLAEIQLEQGYNYAIEIQNDGYMFYSENIDLQNTSEATLLTKTITLQKMLVGNKIVLKNVFFDKNKASLKPESKTELDLLYNLLEKNSKLNIEISGHTDDTGTDDLNQKISYQRARSVAEYLVKKGIDMDRLTYVGYGKMRPVASNLSEEGRTLNRRTEFKILK
jgi:outer membrane protein OmpA-like peptidoglycan-associated protein